MTPRAKRLSGGFTLLELLVAMTLLSLIAILVTGGLRLGARAWDAKSEAFERSADIQTVRSFLQRQLSQTYPVSLSDAEGTRVAFRGMPDRLTFATLMPTHIGLGGFYLVSLQATETFDRRRFTTRLRLSRPELSLDELDIPGEDALESTLLEDIAGLQFGYFGPPAPDAPPEWLEEWTDPTRLPSLILVRVMFSEDDERQWPPLVVAPMITGTPEFFVEQDFDAVDEP